MTLGEVKVEALRLIGANTSEDVRAEKLEELLLEEKYKAYLVNMVGPINRALSIFARRGVRGGGACDKGEGRPSWRIGHETPNVLDLAEIGVSDSLAEILPLYIQSELQRGEDPEAAAMALSMFERLLTEIMGHEGKRQACVLDVMGGLK